MSNILLLATIIGIWGTMIYSIMGQSKQRETEAMDSFKKWREDHERIYHNSGIE